MDELEMRMYIDLKLKEFTDGVLKDIQEFFEKIEADQNKMSADLDKRMTELEEDIHLYGGGK